MTEAEEDLDTWGGCHAVFLIPSYLAHLTSWETVFVDIPATYYDLGFWGAAHRRCSRQSFPPDVLQDLVDDIRVRHIGDHPQPPAAVRAHRDLDPEHASQPLRPGQRRLRRSSEFSLLIVVCHRTAIGYLISLQILI